MCRYLNKPYNLAVIKKESRCRYHHKGSICAYKQISPKKLCPELYHSSYPYCLSLAYGVILDKVTIVKCPSNNLKVYASIIRRPPSFTQKMLVWLKQVLNIFMPQDIIKSRVFIRIEKVMGDCPNEHETGQEYEFNLGNEYLKWPGRFNFLKRIGIEYRNNRELCPAAFDAYYPLAGYFFQNKCFPWFNDAMDTIQCPDHVANITFQCK